MNVIGIRCQTINLKSKYFNFYTHQNLFAWFKMVCSRSSCVCVCFLLFNFNSRYMMINSMRIQKNGTKALLNFVVDGCCSTFKSYLPFEFKNVNEKLWYTAYHFIAACSQPGMVQSYPWVTHAWVTASTSKQSMNDCIGTSFNRQLGAT